MAVVIKCLGLETELTDTIVEPTLTVPGWEIYTVPIRADVWETNEQLPILGNRAVSLNETDFVIGGFQYNKRHWEDDTAFNRNNGIIPLQSLTEFGTLETYWQSGVSSFEDIRFLQLNSPDTFLWEPVIEHGSYHSFNNQYYFFSDFSILQQVTSDTDFTIPIALSFSPGSATVEVATYYRSAALEAKPAIRFTSVGRFTGLWDEATESYLDTLSGDVIVDANVDTFNRWEVLIDDNLVYFNQSPVFNIGISDSNVILNGDTEVSTNAQALTNVLFLTEQIGASNDNVNQVFFTYYLPLDQSTLKLYVFNDTEVRQWSLATNNNLAYHDDTEYVFSVDSDLGLIKFASMGSTETFLTVALTDLDLEIEVISTDNFPESGRLDINGETIVYLSKDDTTFYQLIRSNPANHSINSTVQSIQAGAIPNGSISVSYTVIPRIEYEPLNFPTSCLATDTNVHPLKNANSNGIVYVTRRPPEVASIVLSIDLPALGNDYFGPMYAGNNYALLTATAYGADGTPVPNVEITIDQLDSFMGLLNGIDGPYTSLSNNEGEVIVPWVIGNELDQLGVKIHPDNVTVGVGSTTLTVEGDYSGIDLNKVLIFAITKDDPQSGTVGIISTGSYASSTVANSAAVLTVNTIKINGVATSIPVSARYGDNDFANGTVFVHETNGTVHEATILFSKANGAQYELYINQSLTITSSIDFIQFLGQDWAPWLSAEMNGRKKVIYKYDSEAINPLTNLAGAYYPYNPSSVTFDGTYSTFTIAAELQNPQPASNVENNVGGYWLNVAKTVGFQASTTSFITREEIVSNTIYVNIELPTYLSGVELINSSKTPWGFRIYEALTDASTGLDGSTFVTINPTPGSYAAISNPFMSITHLLTI